MTPNLREELVREANALGVGLSPEHLQKLDAYLELLLLWNRRINLTSVRVERGIVVKHFLDSLAVAKQIPQGASTLVDVGSGAGFPGLVLAILAPALTVTVVEPNQKKVAFLRAVARELPLPNAHVRADRVEILEAEPHRFAVAVSRATWTPSTWLGIGARLVEPDGLIVAMEGSAQTALPYGCERRQYLLPDGENRALLLWRPGVA